MKTNLSRVNRGEQLLQRAVDQHKLSPSGVAAFEFAVDPFHDKPIENLRGWPDKVTTPSVVRNWKQSITVKAKDLGGSILIYSWPLLDQADLHLTSRRNSVVDTIFSGVSTDTVVSPVTVYNFPAAAAAGDLPILGNQYVQHSFSVPDQYFNDGPCRLLGLGIEVHDVTAEMYKQGTITICEVPQTLAGRESVVVEAQTVGGVAYVQTPQDIATIRRYPKDMNQMMSYPLALQWAAKDGCYAVSRFCSPDNDPTYAEYRTPWVNVNAKDPPDVPNALNTTQRMLGQYASGSINGDNFIFNPHAYTPLDSKCIYISGLADESTYTITVSMALESFPDATSDLWPLAKPSAAFDPKALALISMVMKDLPIACPVADNPAGEWFWSALETAIPLLSTAASAFFPEFAIPISMAGTAATAAVSRRRKKNSEKEVATVSQKQQRPALPPVPPKKKK